MIFLVRDIAKSYADQKRYETCHEDGKVVDFFVDVIIRPTCSEMKIEIYSTDM